MALPAPSATQIRPKLHRPWCNLGTPKQGNLVLAHIFGASLSREGGPRLPLMALPAPYTRRPPVCGCRDCSATSVWRYLGSMGIPYFFGDSSKGKPWLSTLNNNSHALAGLLPCIPFQRGMTAPPSLDSPRARCFTDLLSVGIGCIPPHPCGGL